LLVVLEALWVNLHIYFFIGFFIISAFIVGELSESIIYKKKVFTKNSIFLMIIAGLMFISSLVNPHGFKGVLYPFSILNKYGIDVSENQPFWIVMQHFNYPTAYYLIFSYCILFISWVYAGIRIKKGEKVMISNLLISIFILFLSFKAVRNNTLYGYFMFPIVAINLQEIKFSSFFGKLKEKYWGIALLGLTLFGGFYVILNLSFWSNRTYGLALDSESKKINSLIHNNNFPGPIFNNFDIGSFLIYNYYPQKQVFIDNRPETYPEDFLYLTYRNSLLDEYSWLKLDSKYHFNTIFVYRIKTTQEVDEFLQRRSLDPRWKFIYFDQDIAVLVKKNMLPN
jgi:hypothetical protein